ncbi:hypothetical protein [Actinoplanes sp. NPDC026670]|uniref:hypothetical protein n=1 Tax=Actinoplanes sp. NPDC026670 TaxID=3154700 RepID=UPI0033EF6C06
MVKIFWNLIPPTAKELDRVEKRLKRLTVLGPAADQTGTAFLLAPTGKQLAVRPSFIARPDTDPAVGDFSDRGLPDRSQRPPSTRLISPRGIALRFYLTALFVAQSRSDGERPSNLLPLNDPDEPVSWVDLVATAAVRATGTRTSISVRDKKLRQVHEALARLAHPSVDLVELPNAAKPVGTYEGFLLKQERGSRYHDTDEPNETYRIPSPRTASLVRLPAGLFLNGWIHVLEDSELAMVLMVALLHAKYGSGRPVYVDGDTRLRHYGLSRDTYMTHATLERFGLLEVEPDEARDFLRPGKVTGYKDGDPPPKLHRFRLLPDGFEQPAATTVIEALQERSDAGLRAARVSGAASA